VIVQARGWDRFLHLAGVLGRADVVALPHGANRFELDDDAELDDDVRAELAAHSDFAGAPPVVDDAGAGPAELDTGHQPVSSRRPLPRPPAAGPGSGRKVWARYALSLDPPLTVTADMTRDDIIRAVEAPPDDC
jgi:hypothetical protein